MASGEDEGGCVSCGRTVPGRIGEKAICPHCGTRNVIQGVIKRPHAEPKPVPRPAEPVAPASSPAPEARRFRFRLAPALSSRRNLISLGIVGFLFATGLLVPTIRDALDPPPNMTALTGRLDAWDADGRGGPFRIDAKVYREKPGSSSASEEPEMVVAWSYLRVVRPQEREMLTIQGATAERRSGDFYELKVPSRSQWFRDYADPNLPATHRVTIHERDGRDYQGTIAGRPFHVELDDRDRFREILYADRDAQLVELRFSYDATTLSAFAPTGPKTSPSIPRPVNNQYPGQVYEVFLTELEDAVMPEELQVIFYDLGDVPVQAATFKPGLDRDGYLVQWNDANTNGLVDYTDSYQLRFPSEANHARIYDLWSGTRAENAHPIDRSDVYHYDPDLG